MNPADQTVENPAGSQTFSDVAVLLPCYNEAPTIAKVINDFRAALPGASVYVYDNNSTDDTAAVAREAGATVVRSARQGKGNVVRHMFATIDAAYCVMADGDDTYPAADAPRLVQLARESEADMVVGTRLQDHRERSFRRFHQLGNNVISGLIRTIFQIDVKDVLSGYRVFSRDFVRSVPLSSPGFEIETELTLQAAAKNFVIRESPIQYGERPEGSYSKLSTWGDGLLILKMIFLIFKDYKPLTFFGTLGITLAVLSLLAGSVPVYDYFTIGRVPHFPLAILAAALGVVTTVTVAIGLLLHTIRNYHNENFELWRRIARRMDGVADGNGRNGESE